MPNSLYSQLNNSSGVNNPMLNRILQFKQQFSGDPKQMVQSLLNSGRITQAQLNQYAQQANELYKLIK